MINEYLMWHGITVLCVFFIYEIKRSI